MSHQKAERPSRRGEEFRYLKVLFTSDGKIEGEVARWCGISCSIGSYRTIKARRELSQKAKLSV